MDENEKYVDVLMDTNDREEYLEPDGRRFHARLLIGPRRKLMNLIHEKKMGETIKYYCRYHTDVLLYRCFKVEIGENEYDIDMDACDGTSAAIDIAARGVYCIIENLDFEKTPSSFFYKEENPKILPLLSYFEILN